MKRETRRLSEDEVRTEFPIVAPVPGWFFSMVEQSPGIYRVEGTDLWGHRVSRTGPDDGTLLERSYDDARKIAAQLDDG